MKRYRSARRSRTGRKVDVSVPTAERIKNTANSYVVTPRLQRGVGGMQGKTYARETLRRAPKVITSLA